MGSVEGRDGTRAKIKTLARWAMPGQPSATTSEEAVAFRDEILERVKELEGALEHTLTEINDAVRRGMIPASAVNTWKADQALEDDDVDAR